MPPKETGEEKQKEPTPKEPEQPKTEEPAQPSQPAAPDPMVEIAALRADMAATSAAIRDLVGVVGALTNQQAVSESIQAQGPTQQEDEDGNGEDYPSYDMDELLRTIGDR